MAYEQREGQGSLFRNDKKDTEQQPDYRGSILIGGVEHWLSAWIKTSKAGAKYMSLSAQPKEKKAPPALSGKLVTQAGNFDDELPPF